MKNCINYKLLLLKYQNKFCCFSINVNIFELLHNQMSIFMSYKYH